MMEKIKVIDFAKTPINHFKKHLADVVILNSKNKILLQHRPLTWNTAPDRISLFGGHVEPDEQPIDAAIREIKEETGGSILPDNLIYLDTVSESWTKHSEAVHIYFWHDKNSSITGCYEGNSIEFNTAKDAIKHPKIMSYASWAINQCMNKGLIS